MNRLCVFAHWDKDNIIDDYVIYYLKELKKIAKTIIFVSDCDLESSETQKLQDVADYVIAYRHGEYDFGSYKRGFLFAKEQNIEFDELLLVNDSCYGPFYSLKPIFEKMSKKKCDIWGLTKNCYGIKKVQDEYKKEYYSHVQSYFLVLKRNLYENDIFLNFITGIKKEKCKNDVIINYELGLNRLVDKNHFKKAAYINNFLLYDNFLILKWDFLIKKDKFPLLKTSIVREGIYYTGPINYSNIIKKYSDYPLELIQNNAKRYRILYEDKYTNDCLYRKIRYHILKYLPMFVRKFVIFMEKNLFKIINRICFNKLKKF